jgi:hypothetical protein
MPRIYALTALLLSYCCIVLPAFGSTLNYEIYNQDIQDLQKVVGFRLLVPARSSPFINPYDTPIDPWVDNIPPAGQMHLFEIPIPHTLTGATIDLYYFPNNLEASFKETKDEQFLEQFKIWKADTIKLDLPSGNPPLYKFKLTLRRDYEMNLSNSRSVNDLFKLLDDTHNDLLLPSFIRKLLSFIPTYCWDRIFSYGLPDRER